MEEKTLLICEGGYNTLAYLNLGGIKPDRVYFEPLLVKDYLPYIGDNDTVLVVLTGLSDFTAAEVVEVVGLLNQTGCENIFIFNPFALNFLVEEYYVYEGDLLTTPLKWMNAQKEVTTKEGFRKRQKKENIATELYFYTLVKAEKPFEMNISEGCQIVEVVPKKETVFNDYSIRRYLKTLIPVRMWK